MRSGDIGDEAARAAEDAELPLDLAAVRADDDLIEALASGLVPPPSGPRDPTDVEGELIALLAGWVADVRPESLLHPVGRPVAVQLRTPAGPELDDGDEPLAAVGSPPTGRSLLEYEDAEPVAASRWHSRGARPYLLRAAAALVAIALIGSGVVVRSYDAHPGDSLWLVAKVVFPAKSRSVEAATVVSTALNTARVALETGRIEEARAAFQTVRDQLGNVDDADGRAELIHQSEYLTVQLGGVAPAATEQTDGRTAGPPIATGEAGATIPSSPAVTPGATQALSTPSTVPSVLADPSGPSSEAASGAPSEGAADGAPTGSGSASAPAVVAAPAGDPAVSAPPAVDNPAPAAAPDAASGSSAGSPPAVSPPSNPGAPAPSPEPPAPTSAPAAPPVDPPASAQPTADPPADNGASGGSGGSGGSADPPANSPNSVASDSSSSSGSGGSSDASASNQSSSDSSGSSSGGSSSGGSSSGGSSDGSGSSSSGSSSGGSSSSGSSSSGSSNGGSSSSGSSSSGSSSGQQSDSSVSASADISVDGLAGSTLGAVTGVVASTAGS